MQCVTEAFMSGSHQKQPDVVCPFFPVPADRDWLDEQHNFHNLTATVHVHATMAHCLLSKITD